MSTQIHHGAASALLFIEERVREPAGRDPVVGIPDSQVGDPADGTAFYQMLCL